MPSLSRPNHLPTTFLKATLSKHIVAIACWCIEPTSGLIDTFCYKVCRGETGIFLSFQMGNATVHTASTLNQTKHQLNQARGT